MLPHLLLSIFTLPTISATPTQRDTSPIINLGPAGTYRGILQNNGTVESYKGIPYAAPPLGDLRFKTPRDLPAQNGTVVDVSVDALRCVQFGVPAQYATGPRAGPGVEDCLKIWAWKPVTAKQGDNLPVMVYIHGGGWAFSSAASNDFSDWVGQDQSFVAFSIEYRLGPIGLWGSASLLDEGEYANAAILDQRKAIEWVAANAWAFGGNGKDITLMGQSAGGGGVTMQMTVFDGKGVSFQKACPRSLQAAAQFDVYEVEKRNTLVAQKLNCTGTGAAQLACMRKVDPYAIVTAALNVTADPKMPGYNPTIDYKSVTGKFVDVMRQGKFARVPLLTGTVNDEANLAKKPTDPTYQNITIAGINAYNMSQSTYEKVLKLYPVNATFADASGDSAFMSSGYKAAIFTNNLLGDPTMRCGVSLVAQSYAKYKIDDVYLFRFNAPTVGTDYGGAPYPLAYVPHSSDNSYLQNATSVMTSFEKPLALEWRSYIGSFIKSGNPNAHKLKEAPYWHKVTALGDYKTTPVRLVPGFHFTSDYGNATTGTQVEVIKRPNLERCEFWLGPDGRAAMHN